VRLVVHLVVQHGFCTFPFIEKQPGIPILAIAKLTEYLYKSVTVVEDTSQYTQDTKGWTQIGVTVTLSTALFLSVLSIAQGTIGRDYFIKQLRYHKKRFARVWNNKQAYNKIVDKCQFFEQNVEAFGVVVIFDQEKKIFKSQLIKTEEPEIGTTYYVSVPYGYLPKLPLTHVEQA
jgi:hypothetical protein